MAGDFRMKRQLLDRAMTAREGLPHQSLRTSDVKQPDIPVRVRGQKFKLVEGIQVQGRERKGVLVFVVDEKVDKHDRPALRSGIVDMDLAVCRGGEDEFAVRFRAE